MNACRFRKRVVAVGLVSMPVLGTASGLVGPHYASSDGEMLSRIAADQLGWNVSAFLGLLTVVASLLAVLGLVHMLRFRAPALRGIGGTLALLGVLGLPGLIATDLVKGQMAKEPDRAVMVALAHHYAAPSGIHWFYRMLIVYSLGLLLLAVGLGRARIVKWWAAALFGSGALAAFAFDAIPGGHDGFGAGTLVAGAIFLAGSCSIAWRVLTSSGLDRQAIPQVTRS